MIQRFFPSVKTVSRLALVITVTGSVVGCGSDAMRVDQSTLVNPFNGSSRFGSSSQSPSSSNKPVMMASDSTGAGNRGVQSAPLPSPLAAPVAQQPLPQPKQGIAQAAKEEKKGWVAAGGKTITVAAGDSVKSLSERYNVPEKALLAANNIKSSKAKLKAGTELVIPVNRNYSAPVETASPVQGLNPQSSAKSVPQPQQAQAKPATPPVAEVKTAAKDDPRKAKAEPEKTAKAEKAEKPEKSTKTAATAKSSEPAPDTTASLSPQQPAEPAAAAEFRWPARGHIVQSFGEKGGVKSDGINIALPEGTPVKAAESGVVAYAGNELKGYGNLVLIRHDNGFVSAYANNGDIKVKKGDVIRRGQVVATSGQTGNVTSPQLHFELRKGSTPVDPMQYLSGN
jgi:murein DD-endopeptidase MepM/ murein hydrolase activator NlpD